MTKTEEAVAVIEAAIREHNASCPDRIQVAWGYRNADDETRSRKMLQQGESEQEGLLSYQGDDFELSMFFVSDDGRDPEFQHRCKIHLFLDGEDAFLLPRNHAGCLLKVLQAPDDAINLMLLSGDGEDEGEIVVLGVYTALPIVGISGKTLVDALVRLQNSAAWVHELFTEDDAET
jgi:hypothetical protein